MIIDSVFDYLRNSGLSSDLNGHSLLGQVQVGGGEEKFSMLF